MLKMGFVFLHMLCWTRLACETCNIEGAPDQDYIVLIVPNGFAQVGLFQVNIDEAWPARIENPTYSNICIRCSVGSRSLMRYYMSGDAPRL